MKLSESLQLIERQIVTRQMEQRVDQHRTVTGGQQESVAIEPLRILRIVPHEARPKNVSRGRHPKRQTRMSGIRFLNSVDGQCSNGIDAELIYISVGRGSHVLGGRT